jgi:CRP-like cAMP-binding protein
MKLTSVFADTSNSRFFTAGTSIFEKGDKGEEMYVVKEGEVDIVIDGFRFETIVPEGIFGELSLVDQETESPPPWREVIAIFRLLTSGSSYFLFRKRHCSLFRS